ncbi:MAG: phosphate ABC transporter ATP-binding protein [Thermoprotei archaeon]|nr:MAG: phosphate ABC transporter ATP-binding protein [Thermoprotei archaeon]
MIEAREVWFSYANEQALRGMSLAVGRGVTVVVGPNGAGKTTLLKVMAGLYRPDSGSVLIDGEDLWACPPRRRLELRRRVVYVHEKPVLLRGTVLYNVSYGLLVRGVDARDAAERAREVANLFGLAELLDRDSRSLSAGQAQLIAIARAVAVRPKYLLLDEPLASLDRTNRRVVLGFLEELRRSGTGVAIATHDRLLALEVADRAVVVEGGRVVAEGAPEALL